MGCLRRFVVIGLLVALAVGLVADRGAAYVVGRLAERGLEREGLGSPEVTAHGFPFLTQLAGRELDEVEVEAATVARGGFTGQDLRVRALDVSLEGTSTLGFGSVEGEATVAYAAVAAAAGLPADALQTAGDLVQVTRSARVLGREVTVVGRASLAVRGARVVVAPQEVRVLGAGGAELSAPALLRAARDLVRVGYSVRGLPAGLRVTDVRPVQGGLRVSFDGGPGTFSRSVP